MPQKPSSTKYILPSLALSVVAATLIALSVGGANLSLTEIVATIKNIVTGRPADDTLTRILFSIRLPRIVLALAVGAGMGLAGLASQTLFRNPLASPYVLGISNGAAVGAVAAMLLVGKFLGYGSVAGCSLLGGGGVAVAVFILARKSDQFGHALLLTGIAVSALCSAITAVALFLAGERLQTLVFWLMGGFWTATWRDVLLLGPLVVVGWMSLAFLAPAMNVALVGDRSAVDLGVPARRLQIILLLLIAVLTSASVAVSGVIGFVGLIVPHLLRLVVGANHRRLIPASALGGAFLLLAADTVARTAAAPLEIPVGIVTALIGAPVFLWLLRCHTHRGGWA